MKFIVDSLPYYGEDRPFELECVGMHCHRYWDKYEVTSIFNLQECDMLREMRHYERYERQTET